MLSSYYSCVCLFLRGYIKERVFVKPIHGIETLKTGKTDAMSSLSLTEEILDNMWRETVYRLDIPQATNGVHAEIY